jgi:RNA polymerase sigma factor (TIGR02999 family)
MTTLAQHDITQVLADLNAGDAAAHDRLLSAVYDELRELARGYLRRQRAGHTLEPTALVHEAYVRLIQQDHPGYQSRVHFFAVAAKAMRQLLIDHARRKGAAKRGEGWERITLSELRSARTSDIDLLDLDEALGELGRLDAQQCRIVELRFFGGLTIEETAEEVGVSTATVEREWRSARAWLSARLSSDVDA